MADPDDDDGPEKRPKPRRRYWWELSVKEREAVRRSELDEIERRIRADREALHRAGREW
ncbi:MAG TPA: hypothetical protein VMU64_07020 [Acidimicrobiales bacterium]|nr:hypothetical protein [Acidimicrobiales bacterium]